MATSTKDRDTTGEDIFTSLEQSVQQPTLDSLSRRAQQEAMVSLQRERLAWSKSRRKHRKSFDNKTFNLLRWQVGFLSLFVLLQGFSPLGFKLDSWVFGLFINGSLIYTYAIIRYIASDLFNGDHTLLKPQNTTDNNE